MKWFGTELLDHVLEWRANMMSKVHVGLEQMRRTGASVVSRVTGAMMTPGCTGSFINQLNTCTHSNSYSNSHQG